MDWSETEKEPDHEQSPCPSNQHKLLTFPTVFRTAAPIPACAAAYAMRHVEAYLRDRLGIAGDYLLTLSISNFTGTQLPEPAERGQPTGT